ncbi:MAG TPA: Gfo/Idh/MocA family oxidoreductase [Candidatus Acidoferrum sp.]|nr:Gfo/Idh/MocA family oxidoreductase [Candidatus Acidoferrum sp.]
MRTISWGMIGCGDVTEVKSGPGFQKAKHSRLVAVMRRNGDMAKDYARRHGVPKWYDTADALIADPEVDAVYIATPPHAHKPYTLMVARAGKPVYVEKPMAMNFAECQAMLEACRAANVPLLVAYYRRALDRFLKVKQIVETGEIGQPRAVTIALHRPHVPPPPGVTDWRVDPAVAGGGRFVDLACHTLDFLDYVLGPIRTAHGVATNQAKHHPAEDIVAAAFEFSSGVEGVGLWWFASLITMDRTEILGTLGRVTFSTFDETPILIQIGGQMTECTIPYPPHVQQPLIQTVVNQLNGHGPCPSTGETAARTSWVMDQILAAYRAAHS